LGEVLDMEFSPEERKRFTLKVGDLIVSEASGSPDQVGKPAVWQDEIPGCCFQNTVLRLRPTWIALYLLWMLRFPVSHEGVRQDSRGSASTT